MYRFFIVTLVSAVIVALATAPPFEAPEASAIQAVESFVEPHLYEQEGARMETSPLQDLYPGVELAQLRSVPRATGSQERTRNPLRALSTLWKPHRDGGEEESSRTLTRTNALSREEWARFVQQRGMKRTTAMGALRSRGGVWLGKLLRPGGSATDRHPPSSTALVDSDGTVWQDKHVVYEQGRPSSPMSPQQ